MRGSPDFKYRLGRSTGRVNPVPVNLKLGLNCDAHSVQMIVANLIFGAAGGASRIKMASADGVYSLAGNISGMNVLTIEA